jgi:hypothetical protein
MGLPEKGGKTGRPETIKKSKSRSNCISQFPAAFNKVKHRFYEKLQKKIKKNR